MLVSVHCFFEKNNHLILRYKHPKTNKVESKTLTEIKLVASALKKKNIFLSF